MTTKMFFHTIIFACWEFVHVRVGVRLPHLYPYPWGGRTLWVVTPPKYHVKSNLRCQWYCRAMEQSLESDIHLNPPDFLWWNSVMVCLEQIGRCRDRWSLAEFSVNGLSQYRWRYRISPDLDRWRARAMCTGLARSDPETGGYKYPVELDRIMHIIYGGHARTSYITGIKASSFKMLSRGVTLQCEFSTEF